MNRFLLVFIVALCAAAGDWTTYGHDPARTGWASDENKLNAGNVSGLRLQWRTHVNNEAFSIWSLTAPVVITNVATEAGARDLVYVAGIRGTVFALDGETGELVWSRTLRSMTVPKKGGLQGTFLCPNGTTATPVLDRKTGALYVIAPDGALYGLGLATGKVQYGPLQFVAPFAKTWSLNLVDGSVFTTVSLGCGNGRSGIYAADIRHPRQPAVREVLLSNAYTAGIWGFGGLVIGADGRAYGGTADGDTDPSSGDYSNTVISASLKEFAVSDYFLPPNWKYLKKEDFDLGSASPVWFSWNNRNILAHGAKEAVVYLLDADQIGGKDHQTALFTSQRLGNDSEECCAGAGIWGGLSTSVDGDGQRWLFVPVGGPPSKNAPAFPISHGPNPHGSIMAFKIVADPRTQAPVMESAWMSGDFHFPDPVVIANGVIFALSNGENPDQHGDESKRSLNTRSAVLQALDARTGKELYTSGRAINSWIHFSGLAVANGRIYLVDHDSNVYCFGLGNNGSITRLGRNAPAENQEQLSTSWIGRAERQEEFLRTWILRGGISGALVLIIGFAGAAVALVENRRSGPK